MAEGKKDISIHTVSEDVDTLYNLANQRISKQLLDIAFTSESQKQALKEKECEWKKEVEPKSYANKLKTNLKTNDNGGDYEPFNSHFEIQDFWDGFRCLVSDIDSENMSESAIYRKLRRERQNKTKQNQNLLSEDEDDILKQIFDSSNWEEAKEVTNINQSPKNARKWTKASQTSKRHVQPELFSLEDENRFKALSDSENEIEPSSFPPEPLIRDLESENSTDSSEGRFRTLIGGRKKKRGKTKNKDGKCKECMSDCLTDVTDNEFFHPKRTGKQANTVVNESPNETDSGLSDLKDDETAKLLTIVPTDVTENLASQSNSKIAETQPIKLDSDQNRQINIVAVNKDHFTESRIEEAAKMLDIMLKDAFPEEPEWEEINIMSDSEMEEILPIERISNSECQINSIVKPNTSNFFIKEKAKSWPVTESYKQNTRIREQPFVSTSTNTAGNKFRVLFTVSGGPSKKTHLLEGIVDSGAYLSTISMAMVRKLGLEPYKVEPSYARSATDKMLIEHNIQIDLDFGEIKIKCTFACLTHSSYKQGLLLIGANFLEELNVMIAFGRKMMYIMEKYPVQLYTTSEEANVAAIKIRSNKIANMGVDIIAPHDITIDGLKYLDVTLKKQQKERLRGKDVVGRINSSNPVLFAPQYFFESSNNWDDPVPIKIMTESEVPIVIKQGERIFALRQSICKQLAYNDEKDHSLLTVSCQLRNHNYSAINNTSHDIRNGDEIEDLRDPENTDNYLLMLEDGERYLEDGMDSDFEEEVETRWREGGLIGVVEADRKRKREDEEDEPSFCDLQNDLSSNKKAPIYKIADEDFPPEITDQVRQVVMEAADPEPGDFVMEDKKLPEWIRSKIKLDDNSVRPKHSLDRTRLVKRPWSEEDENLFIEARDERERHFDFMGRDRFFEKIQFGSLLTKEWTDKFKALLWKYRGTFGDQVLHLRSPMKHFGAHYGRLTNVENPGVKARKCSEFGAEVFKRVMKIHLDGHVIGYTGAEGKNFAHIVEKKLPDGMKRITTIAELEKCSSADLQKRYRLTVDLSKMSKQIYPFSIPLPSPKTIIYKLHTQNFWSSFDLLSFFFQLSLTASSSELTNFIGGGDNSCVYTFFRNTMGCRSALALSAAVSFLNYPTADISYVDNLITVDKTLAEQYRKIESILKASYENGFILKWTGSSIGLTALETKFEIMGFIISMGKVTIPTKDHFSQTQGWPKTKKFIQKLTNSLNYFNNTSCCFSVISASIRAEMRLMNDERKFTVSNRLENLVNMLLILVKHNKGIRLLSEEELQNQPKFLFCDASKMGFGASLLTIKNDHLVPIAATSRSFSKTNQYLCCNFLETYAVYLAMHLFAPLISLSHTIVLTDSAYCHRMNNTPNFESIPRKLRKQIIELKSRFDYSVIKIAGKDNIEADILSRFCIPRPPVTTTELENFEKIAKFHMKSIKLDEEKKQKLIEMTEKGRRISDWAAIHEEIGELQNFSQEVHHLGKEPLEPCTFLDELCDPCSMFPDEDESASNLSEGMIKLSIDEKQKSKIPKTEYKKIDSALVKMSHLNRAQKGERYLDGQEEKIDAKMETNDSRSEPKSEPEPKFELKPVPKLGPKTKLKTEPEHEHVPKFEPERKSVPKLIPEPELEPEFKHNSVFKLETRPKVAPESRPMPIDSGFQRNKKLWDTENSSTETDCDYSDSDSSIERHRERLKKRKVKFKEDELYVIDFEKIGLPGKGRVKTLQEVDEDMLKVAEIKCTERQLERLKKAKSIILESDTDDETAIPIERVSIKADRPSTTPTNFKPLTNKIDQSHRQEGPITRRSALKRRQSQKVKNDNDMEIEESQNETETEKDRKKTKIDASHEQKDDSKEQQKHKEIDQEINIILGENQTQTGSFGLNTVEKLKDSYIVQRDIELETDFILSICSDIADFNTEQLNDYPVAEGQISDEKENTDILALEKVCEPELVKTVRNAQKKSPEIEQIMELVKLSKKPTRIELRSKSQFIKSACRDFDLLSISEGLLYRKFVTQTGTVRKLLVVPDEICAEVLKQLHCDLAHAKPLRIKEMLFKHVFIFDITKIAKEMACLQCALAAKPVFRRPRKNSVRNSTIGEEIAFDLLFLEKQKYQGSYWKYCLVICESCSGFLIARPLKTKRMSEVKANLESCLLSFHLQPLVATHDGGTEFVNTEIQNLFKQLSITSCIVTSVNKNSNLAEVYISTLTNTLRKMGSEASCWPEVLQKAVFSINHSLREYAPNHVYSAAQVFNNRSTEPRLPFFEQDSGFDIYSNLKELNKARFHDDYDIALCVRERFEVNIGDVLLCHEEKVLAKKALNCERTAVKLSAYWAICKIQEIISEDIVIVKTHSGSRKAHVRQLKRIQPYLMAEIKKNNLANF